MSRNYLARSWYYPAMKIHIAFAILLMALYAPHLTSASEQADTPDEIEINDPPQFPEPIEDPGPLSHQEKELVKSAYAGDLAKVEVAVKKGANVNAPDQKNRTPLIFAAHNGHTSVVEYLVGAGADVNAKDSGGQAALLYASKRSFNETAAFLLENGAEVNVQSKKKGITALMLAAVWDNVELVQLLLEHGADPNLRDSSGRTAKLLAQKKGNSAVVDLLPDPPAQE